MFRMILFLFVVALSLSAMAAENGSGSGALKNIAQFSDLTSDFNAHKDKVRIVTLLSPT
jgi:hypothetical protein